MAADPHKTAPSGHSAAMQDQTQELARKLLDLWQDHLSALAQDPTLMAQALKLMAAYSPFPWPTSGPTPGTAPIGGAFAPNPFAGQFPSQFPGFGFPAPAASAGPAPAAAAPDAGAGAVGEFRRRLAELEGRLAELEGGKPAAAKPARKRAGKLGARAPKGR